MFDLINPRQTIIVSARAEVSGVIKDNLITLSWHTPLSFDPMLYGICVGKNRFSYDLIKKGKVFAVNFMPYDMKKEVLYCGRSSGANIDKFSKLALDKQECDDIDCSFIGNASAVLECEVIDEIDTGDHVIFVGQVHKYRKINDKRRILYLGSERFSSAGD